MSARIGSIAVAAVAALAMSATATLAQVNLRFGHDQPPGSMYDAGHVALKELVEEKTAGDVTIQIFPAAQLGNEVAMIEGMRLGSVDGAVIHVANAATVVPELAIFSVAYLFDDRDHYEAVVNDTAFRQRVAELIASKDVGLKLLGFYSAGVRNVYSRKADVTDPADLNGIKIRVMNNPVESQVWGAMGAIPTPMPFGDVYQALQSGVLDAAENGLAVIESNKHYEPASNIVLTEHQRSIALLLMNQEVFDNLSAEHQSALIEAAEAASARERDRDAELNAEAVERMRTAGAQIVTPDKSQFAARVVPIQDEIAANLGMTDVLELIRSHAR